MKSSICEAIATLFCMNSCNHLCVCVSDTRHAQVNVRTTRHVCSVWHSNLDSTLEKNATRNVPGIGSRLLTASRVKIFILYHIYSMRFVHLSSWMIIEENIHFHFSFLVFRLLKKFAKVASFKFKCKWSEAILVTTYVQHLQNTKFGKW